MAFIVNDGTLVRGSVDITISGVVYTLLDIKDDFGKSRMEKDYNALGKPKAASSAQDFRMLTGTIRARSDQAAPPRNVAFTYDSVNFWLIDVELSGSTTGLKQYAVTAQELINAALVIT